MRVSRLHGIVDRQRRTDDNLRDMLWNALWAIEDAGGSILETATGRNSKNPRQRDEMIRDAIEWLTNKHKARSAKIARENGAMSRGRPPRQDVEATRSEVEALWFSPKIAGKDLEKRLRKLQWSLTRAYKTFGPRGGRNT